ncbi:unnamed protein product [Acanthoscelides obtectus]|nr:unnamed protein product [Acanthoscelides obtectus]CAK1671599.1 hypothetical protein AOBTE_LOCUS28354 [Acanthoscelides obtectus]
MGFLDPMINPRSARSNIQSDGSSQTTSEVSDTLATIMGMVEDAPPSPNEENQASTPQADADTQGQPERPESQGASSLPEKRLAHRRRQLLRRGNASRGVRVPVQVQIYKQILGKMDELIRFITQPEVENEDILFGRALAMSLSHVRSRQKKLQFKTEIMRRLEQIVAEEEADQDLQHEA